MRFLVFFLGIITIISAGKGPLEYMQQEQQHVTENMDPGFNMAFAKQVESLNQTIKNHQDFIDGKIESVQSACEARNNVPDFELLPEEMNSKVEDMVEKFVDELLRFEIKAIDKVEERMVAALDRSLSTIDNHLQPIKDQVEELKNSMSTLMTENEIQQLETKLSELVENDVLHESENLATVSEKLNEQLANITDLIDSLSRCQNTESEFKLLNRLSEFEENLEDVQSFVEGALQASNRCNSKFDNIIDALGALAITTGENVNAMSGLEKSLENMQETFATRTTDIENLIKVEDMSERLQSTIAPVSDEFCVDSDFTGVGRSMDFCSAAVRFSRCNLKYVAFHCCKSCKDAGAINGLPVDFTDERAVPIIRALKSLRPS